MPKSAQPSLGEIQRAVLAAVRTPLTSGQGMQPGQARTAQRIIRPGRELDSFQRLEIYNQQYWWRLLAAFGEDFPGVRAVLGPRKFDRLAVAYLTACPPNSWSLRELGARLPQFIREHPVHTAPHTALAGDVALVEWAQVAAFDDAELPRIEPAKLATADPARTRLAVQPYVQLVELHHSADRLISRLGKKANAGTASNAVTSIRSASRPLRLTARPLREPLHLAVHRVKGDVYFKRLDALAHALLVALQKGNTIADACALAVDAVPLAPALAATAVREAFTTFTSLGWLCAPRARSL